MIIGDGKRIKRTLDLATQIATADVSVLIEGETGAGKDLFAKYIYGKSNRNDNPFISINCASLPDALFESELFGHEKGAFTDAKTSKKGLVEIADNGVLFLDEIGELSLGMQPKLLRFLESGEFRRVGGTKNLHSNVRVIAATNKDLYELVYRKLFRKDLLYRLNTITLKIPPLKDRGVDIEILTKHFLGDKYTLKPEMYDRLRKYEFPGNVRELKQIIERAKVFAKGSVIARIDLPKHKPFYNDAITAEVTMTLAEIEKVHIRNVLNLNSWNREKTARALGISQKTLYTKIRLYDLL